MMLDFKVEYLFSWLEIPEDFQVTLATVLGAIFGSAISLAYLLPRNRREAALRFIVGIIVGVIFGSATGYKLADFLRVTSHMSELEIALSGSAFASLSAWWALGMLSRITSNFMNSKK